MAEFVSQEDEEQRAREGDTLRQHLGVFPQKGDRPPDRAAVRLIGAGPQRREDRQRKQEQRQCPAREGGFFFCQGLGKIR